MSATKTTSAGELAEASKDQFDAGLRPRRGRFRRYAIRLVVLGLAVLVALLLAELAVRIMAPQVLFPRYVTASDFGIRVNVPNACYWHTSLEMRAHFRINSLGIRSDREYTFDKPSGTIRIVGLGDSFTQGYEVSVEESYLYQLEELLRAEGYPVEIINLGVSGHGNAEQLIMLKEYGFRFEPDIVVVGYFQNDLNDNVRANLYRLDEQDRLVRAGDSYLPAIGARDWLYSFALYRWLAERSQLLCLVRERVAGWAKRRTVAENLATVKESAKDDYAARLGARLLDQIKEECTQRGVGFVLLDIPSHRLHESNLPTQFLARITPGEIVRTCPALQGEGPGAYLYRRRGHSHWTPAGHRIAAELLRNQLVGLLDRQYSQSGQHR